MTALNLTQYGLEMDKPFMNSDSVLVTTHHYYSSKECIGQGATSCVYKGQHRSTGEDRALKVSKQPGMHRETQREIEAFKILRHPNIVEFYGIEEDIQSGKNVIVMEYCSGGSLFSYLQEPENRRGLCDSEYLTLLKHLGAAIGKLNSCGFVHRDIKPGNVLRSINITGKSVYKISDFGSARPVENDDYLISLAGTEEYLHPNVYEKAFINRSSVINFKGAMDRWSLGVTLCHAAIGDVPFRPHGGARKNRNVMFEMISQKPTGKIRCIQERQGGGVHWYDDLPADCNMTEGLRARIRPVIAGLMEKDERRQWTVSTFLNEVNRILHSQIVHILNTDICCYHTLYMDPGSTFVYISENVAAQTDVPSSRQKYFIDNQPKESIISSNMSIKQFTATSKEKPFICVFLTDDDEICYPPDPVSKKLYSEVFLLSEDCKVSAEISTTIYDICLRVEEAVKAQDVMSNFSRDYGLFMKNLIESIEKDINKEMLIFEEKKVRFQQITDTAIIPITTKDSSLGDKYRNIFSIDIEIKKVIEMVKLNLSELQTLHREAKDCEGKMRCKLCTSKCVSTVDHIFKQSKETFRCMCKRRKNSYLTHMEEGRHKNDKKKMIAYLHFAQDYWKRCKSTSQKLVTSFKEWMRCNEEINHKIEYLREHHLKLQTLSRSFTNGLTVISAYNERERSLTTLPSDILNSLLQQNKSNGTENLIDEGRQLMNSLSIMTKCLHDSCKLDEIGDIETL